MCLEMCVLCHAPFGGVPAPPCVSVARAERHRALLQLMKTGMTSSIWATMRALQSPHHSLETSVLCSPFLIRRELFSKSNIPMRMDTAKTKPRRHSVRFAVLCPRLKFLCVSASYTVLSVAKLCDRL